MNSLKVVALAGGVGGAKLADGLAQILDPASLTVIVNTGDDFDHFGLRICPDLDTVCYTLAGLADPVTGWGRSGDTRVVLEGVGALGGPTWFSLGDLDLATSLERTRLQAQGVTLTQITRRFCAAWNIGISVLPMTDQDYPTQVITDERELAFQEYFVKLHCAPKVRGFIFGLGKPRDPTQEVEEALQAADLVIICPSNPWVSIDPILSLSGVRELLPRKVVVAVSPIIGGKAVKGPAAKMFRELSIHPSPASVAQHYSPFLSGIVIDRVDHSLAAEITTQGVEVLEARTLMNSGEDRRRLAELTCNFSERILAS